MLGVKYSLATGRVRSIIVPDSDAQLAGVPLGKGEGFMTLAPNDAGLTDLAYVQGAVNQMTKIAPAGDLYAVVDAQGNVVGSILADPACGDAIPGCDLVAHPQANALVGNGTTYTVKDGFVIQPQATFPPKVVTA